MGKNGTLQRNADEIEPLILRFLDVDIQRDPGNELSSASMDADEYLSFDHPFCQGDGDHSRAVTQAFLWDEVAKQNDRTIEIQCGLMEGHSRYCYRVPVERQKLLSQIVDVEGKLNRCFNTFVLCK